MVSGYTRCDINSVITQKKEEEEEKEKAAQKASDILVSVERATSNKKSESASTGQEAKRGAGEGQ